MLHLGSLFRVLAVCGCVCLGPRVVWATQEERRVEAWFLGRDLRPVPEGWVCVRDSLGRILEGERMEGGSLLFRVAERKLRIEATQKGVKGSYLDVVLEPAPLVHLEVEMDGITGEVLEVVQTSLWFQAQEIDPIAGRNRPPAPPGPHGGRTRSIQGGGTSGGTPVNDNCLGAVEIFDGFTNYSTAGATTDGPSHPGICEYDGQTYDDIWFRYRASCTGTFTVRTCNLPGDFDTDLVVYPGDVDGDGDLDAADCSLVLAGDVLPLGCSDDTPTCQFQSFVEFSTLQDELYLIRLGGGRPAHSGPGILGIVCAPPPVNDECTEAFEIPCNATLQFDNTGATINPDDPLFPCVLFQPPIHGAGSMWYRFTAEGTNVFISTSDDTGPTAIVALYEGICGSLTELDCNDNFGFLGGICFVDLIPGETYYLQVASGNVGGKGEITLNLDCPGICTPPLGDTCPEAVSVNCNGPSHFENFGAHVEPSDPPFSYRFGGPAQGVGTVWRTFVATASSARLTLNFSMPSLDTLLAVYSGTCGALTELACSDDEGHFGLSELALDGLTPGETYHVQIASYDRFELGRLTLQIACPSPAPPNDTCEGALELGPLPAAADVSLRRALTDPVLCGTLVVAQKNVWYRVTGTGNVLTATVCSPLTRQRDTQINVFCGTCDARRCVTGSRSVFCAVGTPNFPKSTVSWCSQAGASYWLSVGTVPDDADGLDVHLEVFDTGEVCAAEIACLPSGACCLGAGVCVDTTAEDCTARGGVYRGDGSACLPDAVVDGDFEAGYFSGAWTEFSTHFGTPLCDPQRCGFGGGSGPRSGSLWAWFGGTRAFEEGSLEQPIVLMPEAGTLDFFLELPVSSGNGTDFLRVRLDGVLLFEVREGDPAFAGMGYSLVSLPVAAFADGASHRLRFESTITGQGPTGEPALSNFFVDDVSLRGPSDSCRIVLDFEHEDDFSTPLANGQSLSTPPEFGRVVSLTSRGANLGACVFDSTPGGQNDPSQDRDLLVGRGKLLILQNDQAPTQTVPGVFDRPNDDQDGGDFAFDFFHPVEPESVVLVDIDQGTNQMSHVVLTDSSGRRRTFLLPPRWTEDLLLDGPPAWRVLDLTTLVPQPGFGSSATATQDAGFDPAGVLRLEVHLGSSGALDDLVFR